MLHRLYTYFIEPRQKDEDLRNRELVLNVLLVGTLVLLLSTVLLLVLSYFGFHHRYVLVRMEGVTAALVATWWIYFLSRSGRQQIAAWLLIGIYLLIATSVAWRWGVTIPSAALLFGVVIMVTGTVLRSPYPLYVAGVSIIITLAIELAQERGLIRPDLSWIQDPFGISTVSGFCLIFGVIALVSWLFNERTEQSLHRARRAEAGLRRQKLLLESKVEKRTRQLQAAQLEKMQQLYRFAELGQLSTALLHDLANHLTTLTLDIEGLEAESHSHILKRAKRSIRYIDDMVLRVRDQLHGKARIHTFNVASETDEVITILTHKAADAGVKLSWEARSDKKDLHCRGESIRFRQLMANLLGNGIDAYTGQPEGDTREVRVTLEVSGKYIIVIVTDWGKGIDPANRDKLFEPFYSTKKTGMGMGLFIVRQIVEEQFKGSVKLDNVPGHTAFIITLAKG